jgi:hypothetical protein
MSLTIIRRRRFEAAAAAANAGTAKASFFVFRFSEYNTKSLHGRRSIGGGNCIGGDCRKRSDYSRESDQVTKDVREREHRFEEAPPAEMEH